MSLVEFFLYFLFGLVITTCQAEDVKRINGCPERFARHQNVCTTGSFLPQTWTDAEKYCNSLGSNMIMVKSDRQYQALMNDSDDSESLLNFPGNLLVGLKFTVSDKIWRWADGGVFDPRKDWAVWYDGHPPDEPSTDTCMAFKEKRDTLMWKPIQCYESGYAVCFTYATTKVNMCPDGFVQVGPICSTVVMKMDNSWNAGNAACEKRDGSTLMMVKGEYEMEMINHSQHMNMLPVGLWMGLRYYAAENEWKFSDGNVFDPIKDYCAWKSDQTPVKNPTTDKCVILQRDSSKALFEWTLEDCDTEMGLAVCVKKSKDFASQLTQMINGSSDPKGMMLAWMRSSPANLISGDSNDQASDTSVTKSFIRSSAPENITKPIERSQLPLGRNNNESVKTGAIVLKNDNSSGPLENNATGAKSPAETNVIVPTGTKNQSPEPIQQAAILSTPNPIQQPQQKEQPKNAAVAIGKTNAIDYERTLILLSAVFYFIYHFWNV